MVDTKHISFDIFDHDDAFQIGCNLVKKVKEENLKNIRIRIVIEDEIIFQHLMNGKNGDIWLNRKQKTVEFFKQATYLIWQENEINHQYDQYLNDETIVICGGGYPIIVEDKIIGCIVVSGLSHDQDNQIIVDVLKEYKEKLICG